MKINRLLCRLATAVGLFSLSVGLAQANVTNACVANNINVSQGSVFSTFGGGQITASQTGNAYSCNPTFYNSPELNVGAGGYSGPTASGGCKNASTGNVLAVSSQNASTINIPTFQASTATYNYAYSGSAHNVAAGGSSANQIVLLPLTFTWGGRSITVPAYGATGTIPSASYSDWGAISATDGAAIIIQSNATDVHITSLTLSNCGSSGVTFMAGNYYINSLSLGAGCSLSTSGGTVNLYVNNAFTLGAGSCLNWSTACGAAVTPSAVNSQAPSNLRIWANNALTINGAVQGAGALYAAAGTVSFNQSGAAAWVGEVAAPNVNFANAGGVFAYANTGAFTGAASVRKGVYSLTQPAVPTSAKTGDLVYFAEQQDVNSAGQSAFGGHLYANALNADGSISQTSSWDAASMMTLSNRTGSLVTQIATGGLANLDSVANNLVLLALSLVSTLLGNGFNAIEGLLNPNWQGGTWLAGRDPTDLMGRPMGSAPIIANSVVVVATDDGFIYGFDKTSGQLKWGYFPPESLITSLVPGALLGSQPWGQLNYYQYNGVDYVVATGLQGAMHLALKLNPDGSLNSVAWKDVQVGGGSPTAPVGGAAPTMAVDQTGSAAGKIAYIVNNTLVRRSIVDGSNAQNTALPTTATSNLLYINDSTAYYGDSAGNLKGALGAADAGGLAQTSALPMQYVTGAYVKGAANGTGLVLIGASSTKAQAFSQSQTGSWSSLWQFSSASSSALIPNLASGSTITAIPTIYNNVVLFGTTAGSSICTQQAQEVGPLLVLSGATAIANTTYKTAQATGAQNPIGIGSATFATGSMFNGKAYIFADSNGGGTNSPATGWAQYTLDPKGGVLNTRVNWRELTSFITAWMDAGALMQKAGGWISGPQAPDDSDPRDLRPENPGGGRLPDGVI